jgi:hypothetical protein
METYSVFLKPSLDLPDDAKSSLLKKFEEIIAPFTGKPLGFHEYHLELVDDKTELMNIWVNLKTLTDGKALFAMCKHSTDGVTIASGNETFATVFEKRSQNHVGTKLELLREAFRGM